MAYSLTRCFLMEAAVALLCTRKMNGTPRSGGTGSNGNETR
jgi:hypothetical protein